MRIKKISSTSVLKGNVVDSLDGNSTTNAPSISAVKRGTLSYIDNGYPTKPTGFTIVRSIPEYQEPGIIYFVCPIPSIHIAVSLNNSMTSDWTNQTDPITISYNDASTSSRLDWDTIYIPDPNSGGSSFNSFEKDPFTQSIHLGFTGQSRSSENATLSVTFEQRNPNTTALEWWGTCSGSFNGETFYVQDNERGDGGIANILLGSGSSYSIHMSIESPGGSACLKGDTWIKTSEGRKMIKDIQVGDTVIDKENKEVLVTKIFNHDVNYMTRIHLSNGTKIETSLSHKFETNWGIAKSVNLVKDMKLKCGNGSFFKIMKSENIKTDLEVVYEIMTETGSYQLDNGVINICEEI